MTELSPAAQAVFNAYLDNCDGAYNKEWYKGDLVMIAAALRAAADQVVPEYQTTPGGSKIWPSEPVLSIRAEILAIADELEAQ